MIVSPEQPSPDAIWEQIIGTFVVRGRRERARYWLASPKRRNNIVDELTDASFFDPSVLHDVRPATPAKVIEAMKAHGATSPCRAFSPRGSADGVAIDLGEALEAAVGVEDDILLFCPAGPVAYYEGHTPGHQYVLYRSP